MIPPVPINKRMENSQISLNGNGDCHEDTDTEKNVVKRIEKIRQEIMMELS